MRFHHRDPLTQRIARTVRETTLSQYDWFEAREPVYVIGMSGPPKRLGPIRRFLRRLLRAGR